MPQPRLKLAEIESGLLTPLMKGVPGGCSIPLSRVAEQGWNLLKGDLPLPAAVLKLSALERNRSWMQRFLAETGVQLAPHGKTTMSPQLFDMQLADGAWGMTAATIGHVQVYRHFGVQRILLANQLVGRREIASVLDELARDPDFEFFCLVDSETSAQTLATAVRDHGLQRPLQVLIEVGIAGGRSGVRHGVEALELARTIAGLSPHLALRGIECFEGVATIAPGEDSDDRLRFILDSVVLIARAVQAERLFAPGPVILTAGGSSHFDIVVERFANSGVKNAQIVLRSGCYISHDSQLYVKYFEELQARIGQGERLGPGLTGALEVWGYVQSLPEPGLAICTMGKRDVSYDMHLPVPRFSYRPGSRFRPRDLEPGYAIHALNDQHAYVSLPAGHGWRIGDMIGVGISHPCTTFDKWQLLYVVDDDYNVIGAIRTFF